MLTYGGGTLIARCLECHAERQWIGEEKKCISELAFAKWQIVLLNNRWHTYCPVHRIVKPKFINDKRTWRRICERCGFPFQAKAPQGKFCDLCKNK